MCLPATTVARRENGVSDWLADLHLFSPYQPDLNWDTVEVRHAIFDVVNFWAGKGVDGFRVRYVVGAYLARS